MTDASRLYISTITANLTPEYRALPRLHPGAVAYVEEDYVQPTPGQIDLLCLSVQDVINGRLETGDAAADLAAVKEHLDTALKLTGFDGEKVE
jgi:hypothetical protein